MYMVVLRVSYGIGARSASSQRLVQPDGTFPFEEAKVHGQCIRPEYYRRRSTTQCVFTSSHYRGL